MKINNAEKLLVNLTKKRNVYRTAKREWHQALEESGPCYNANREDVGPCYQNDSGEKVLCEVCAYTDPFYQLKAQASRRYSSALQSCLRAGERILSKK